MIQEIEAQKAILDLMIAGKLTTAEMIPMPKKDNKWKKRANEIGIENEKIPEQAYECDGSCEDLSHPWNNAE